MLASSIFKIKQNGKEKQYVDSSLKQTIQFYFARHQEKSRNPIDSVFFKVRKKIGSDRDIPNCDTTSTQWLQKAAPSPY